MLNLLNKGKDLLGESVCVRRCVTDNWSHLQDKIRNLPLGGWLVKLREKVQIPWLRVRRKEVGILEECLRLGDNVVFCVCDGKSLDIRYF